MAPPAQRQSFVLASRSPRRIELLQRIGRNPAIDPADIDESMRRGESAIDYVQRLSAEKAQAVLARHPGAVVLGADTCVELDGVVHGQPVDREEARRTLRTLSGRTHNVHTAVTVASGARSRTILESARVTLQPLGEALVEWYLDTGEPFGKAGAYAVQGHGSVLVTGVRGLMSGVVGLPLGPVAALLDEFGV
ncbi:MAG: septum formation protein Maf [Actinobacteria bacterium]|nr:septum formation protein Maf [Actinomycetota bacterium]